MTPDGPAATSPPMEHRTATVNGVRLYYRVAGSGAAIVLLHGWPQTGREWDRVVPALARIGTVIVPDLRGSGLSDKPVSGYDKANLAKDVDALVAAHGFRRYALVGHDIGAMVAYTAAAQFRDRVAKLAFLDVPIPGIPPWDQAVSDPKVWHFSFHAQRDLAEALIQGREYLYVSRFIRDRAFNPAAVGEAEIEHYARSLAAPGALRGSLGYYRTFEEDAAVNRALAREKLRIPVLGIGGDKRWGSAMPAMVDHIAIGGKSASLPDCGHWLAEERPAELAALLVDFLKP